MDPKIAKLYADVPEEAVGRLLDFRRRFPYREVTIGRRTWRYIDTGEGQRTLFIPSGGTTIVSDPPQPVVGDGETWGETPVTISVLPGAIEVITPA